MAYEIKCCIIQNALYFINVTFFSVEFLNSKKINNVKMLSLYFCCKFLQAKKIYMLIILADGQCIFEEKSVILLFFKQMFTLFMILDFSDIQEIQVEKM